MYNTLFSKRSIELAGMRNFSNFYIVYNDRFNDSNFLIGFNSM